MVRARSKGSWGPPAARGSSQWTIRRVLEWTTGYLRRGGVEAARFEAESLLAHALRVERLEIYLNPERVLSLKERARYRELVRQRRAGTPLTHLLGTAQFMNTTLKVNRSVLIPRVETEELVEHILHDFGPSAPAQRLSVLDLGTGSGAIAVALAKEWPQACVLAVDISKEALKLARENAQSNGVAGRVFFLCCDWFSAVHGEFDLIVSNPPYIPSEEWERLPEEVREHEPRQALDGGPGGLRAMERIACEAPRFLRPGGRLYLEIGAHQAEDVRALLKQTAAFSHLEIRRDLAGRERIVQAIRRSEA